MPCVVCYESRVVDAAAALFGVEFVRHLATGGHVGAAFGAAKAHVLSHTESGARWVGRVCPAERWCPPLPTP